MDGERKVTVFMVGLSIFCITVLYSFLFVSLWRYKELVGLSLLVVVILLAVVYMRGKLNEQHLRRVRYHHQEEIPLDSRGEPNYWPQGVQENPYHASLRTGHASPHLWSEGYQQEQ
jgi:hypothetical protein